MLTTCAESKHFSGLIKFRRGPEQMFSHFRLRYCTSELTNIVLNLVSGTATKWNFKNLIPGCHGAVNDTTFEVRGVCSLEVGSRR